MVSCNCNGVSSIEGHQKSYGSLTCYSPTIPVFGGRILSNQIHILSTFGIIMVFKCVYLDLCCMLM